jgi:hypothetical protein
MRGANQKLRSIQSSTRRQQHAKPVHWRAPLQLEALEERAMPTTITIGASKDNTLYQSTAGDISNGAGSYFIAGETNGGLIRRGVIAFDIAGNISAGATINSVSLSLHMSQTQAGAETVQLQRLTADWGEGTSNADSNPGRGASATTGDATWVYRFYSTDKWSNTGGDFVSTVSASASVGSAGFYTWGSTTQMVTDVQNWLDHPSSSFGWIVIGDESTSQTAKRFDSSKNSTSADRPALTIDYTASTSSAATLAVSGFSSSVTAGMAGTVTVTAKDSSGNTATDYRGTVKFTSSDPQATLPANYTFTAVDAGVHTFTNAVTLKIAGANQSITATDTATSSITGSQTGITVTPAAVDHLKVATPASAKAGTPFDLTVTAQDPYNNTAVNYTGTVSFTSSDTGATLPPNYTFMASDNGVHSFASGAILIHAGSQTVTATDTATSSITGSGPVAVAPAAANHLKVSTPGSATAGAAFDLTVTAQDVYNNTAVNYTGTVTFTSSDAGATLPSNYTFLASDNGVHTFSSGATLILAGSQTIKATDTTTGSIAGTGPVTVSPATLDHFSITSAGTVAAGTPFDLIVTALDKYGNTVTNYAGTVTFTTSDQDPQVSLPANYTFTSADNGTHTFSGGATLYTSGNQTITVMDTSDNTLFGILTVTL